MSAVAARSVEFDNAALLWLKVGAFAVMMLDHVDWLFLSGHGFHTGIGRLVFPVFGVVLAYNLARAESSKILRVLVPRLLLVGVVSQVPYWYLQGHLVPLNILFTLALASAAYALLEGRAWLLAFCMVLVGGVFVDYAWPGVFGVMVCALAFRSRDERIVMLSWFAFALALAVSSGNWNALLAVPVLWLASQVNAGDAPRWKWFFLVGYPAHLVVLAMVKLA